MRLLRPLAVGVGLLSFVSIFTLSPRGDAAPTWATVAPMATARTEHTATAIAGERVLVTGGIDATGAYLSSAEVYDAATKKWSALPAMSSKRAGHTATLLPSGKVLIAGGTANGGSSLATAQIFDPATSTWSAAASMKTVRAHHSAILLSTGLVLVAGGTDFSPGGQTTAAELYDPATDKWTTTGSMATEREWHTSTLLGSGLVLVTGGRRAGATFLTSAELFDPTKGTWSAAGDMLTGRGNHTASLLSGDRVLVAGGRGMDKYGTMQIWDSAELFDPATKAWKATSAPMVDKRHSHTATSLPGDRVLVIGGEGTSSTTAGAVEMFTLSDGRFAPFAALTSARTNAALAGLVAGDLLASGGAGSGGTALASVELLALGHPGDACKSGTTDCASGFCVDGVCCDVACDGACEACDVTGSVGKCSAVKGAPHGARPACSDGAGDACQAKHCDGADRKSCAGFADTTTTCAAASCADGTAKSDAKCDGKGACTAPTSTSCAPFACGGNACKALCAADTDCSGANVCDQTTGKCVVAGPSCSADGLQSQPSDRTQPPKSCAPYRCEAKSGTCLNTCDGSDACAGGSVCDTATHTCVASAAASDSGGCAVGTSGRSGEAAGFALVALGLVVLASRRRHPGA